jgi:20S proteasome subunit beta 1
MCCGYVFGCFIVRCVVLRAVCSEFPVLLRLRSIELDAPPKVQTAAVLFQDIIYQNKDALMAGIIVAGWDKKNGGQVYSITLGGTMVCAAYPTTNCTHSLTHVIRFDSLQVRQPYAIGGSGSAYIYGLCDSEYKPGMSKAECQKFVQKGIEHCPHSKPLPPPTPPLPPLSPFG